MHFSTAWRPEVQGRGVSRVGSPGAVMETLLLDASGGGGRPWTPLGSQVTTFCPHLLVASVCVCPTLPLPMDTGHVSLGLPQGRVCTRCPPRPPPGALTLTSPGRLELQHTRGHGSSPRGQVSVPEPARMASSHPESPLKVVFTTRLNATPS